MNNVGLVERVVEVLDGLDVRVGRHPDGELGLSLDPEAAERVYRVVSRSRLTAPAAATLAVPSGVPVLVVAPMISDAVGQVLRARGLDYVDAAGNVLLRWPGARIDVRGRRAAAPSVDLAGPSARRPFVRSGVQVTFALLAWPQLTASTVREIAEAAGVAVGTTHSVLRDLLAGGYLVGAPSGRQMVRGGELLTRWTEAYALSLYASLGLGLYRAEDPAWWTSARADLADAGVDLGGEAAASVLDERLRPGTVWLYAEQVPAAVLAAHRCRRADDPGSANVIVRRRFWRAPTRRGEVAGGHPPHVVSSDAGLVPSVLVYADLLASGDPRQRDHAQRLRTRDARLERLDRS